jgi:hypothetical protein
VREPPAGGLCLAIIKGNLDQTFAKKSLVIIKCNIDQTFAKSFVIIKGYIDQTFAKHSSKQTR